MTMAMRPTAPAIAKGRYQRIRKSPTTPPITRATRQGTSLKLRSWGNQHHEDSEVKDAGAEKQKQDQHPEDSSQSHCPLGQSFKEGHVKPHSSFMKWLGPP